MPKKPISPARMAALVAGGIAAAFVAMVSLWLLVNLNWSGGKTGTVKAETGDWDIECRVTGSGAADGEGFTTVEIETLAFRDGVRVDRVYKGRRIAVRATVSESRIAPSGPRTIHGTITRIDIVEKRIEMTDCVVE